MEITTTKHNRVDVVKMVGRVDTYSAPKLQEALDTLTEEERYMIVFDMSEVDFLSSKGLWVLTETQKKCKQHKGGELALYKVDEKIAASFELVGMSDYFKTFDDITDAVGNF